jgi:hypothetical protein
MLFVKDETPGQAKRKGITQTFLLYMKANKMVKSTIRLWAEACLGLRSLKNSIQQLALSNQPGARYL